MRHEGFIWAHLQTGGEPDPLEDTLEKLAKEYDQNDFERIITFARCNVATNDVPVEVYHLPTIKLYPASKKRAPLEYFGRQDDIEEYKSFIREEGSKVDQVLEAL